MKSVNIEHAKSKFINQSKIVLALLFSIAFFGITSGQTSSKSKINTSKQKDSTTKSKSTIAKNDKVIASDTIKKNHPLLDQKEGEIDSLFILSGKFKLYKKGAHASYYADKFHDRKTASGKKYDKNKFSAAHKKLPFGTIIKVTNEANGKSVLVEVTDRGPFVRSRDIDLSRRAFMEITANKSSGRMNVTLEVSQK
jgi:rare lipoprotein A